MWISKPAAWQTFMDGQWGKWHPALLCVTAFVCWIVAFVCVLHQYVYCMSCPYSWSCCRDLKRLFWPYYKWYVWKSRKIAAAGPIMAHYRLNSSLQRKNDRPRDDGTLRRMYFLVLLLEVTVSASASALINDNLQMSLSTNKKVCISA